MASQGADELSYGCGENTFQTKLLRVWKRLRSAKHSEEHPAPSTSEEKGISLQAWRAFLSTLLCLLWDTGNLGGAMENKYHIHNNFKISEALNAGCREVRTSQWCK